MALEVPTRDARPGDWGFNGRGGGARSGSELSHLLWLLRVSYNATESVTVLLYDGIIGGEIHQHLG